jgi:signal transduction histidine kinase
MTNPLRLLLIEDSENDAVLLLRELRRIGYAPVSKRVDNAQALIASLENDEWDIVISDFVLPGFSGLEALKIVREKGLDIPFIITSGKISDETAVIAMKAGASDYLSKDNFTRLGPAIERELNEAVIRKERERVLKQLREREQELVLLKRLDRLKDEFIGLVSHELRTPITVIVGALDTVLTERKNLTRKESALLIQDAYWEAEELSSILTNLLELARARADRLQISEEPVSAYETIKKVVLRTKRQVVAQKITIKCDRNLTVLADRVRLEQILRNLINNAIKYSSPETTIHISAVLNNNEIVFRIRDHGRGISMANQKKLFRPFERLSPKQNETAGTGLGLVVCERLVTAQKGHIWVKSKIGSGSTFYFTLPAASNNKRDSISQ